MLRRSAIAAVLAAALAGCGSDDGASTNNTLPKAPNAAPKTGGPGTVGITDGRIGEASRQQSGDDLRVRKGGRLDIRPPKRPSGAQGVGAGASCQNVDELPGAANLATINAAVLCLVNGERADRGLPALSENAQLAAAALVHAQDMVAKQYFSHTGADGSSITDRVEKTGYLPSSGEWTIGENLAWGTGSFSTPKAIVNSWMNSTGHRENILDSKYRDIGMGTVLGNPSKTDGSGATYAHAFGSRSGGGSESGSSSPSTSQSSPPATTGTQSGTAGARSARRRCGRSKTRKARACRARARRAAARR